MATLYLGKIFQNGRQLTLASSDVFDVATKKYLSTIIGEQNTAISNLQQALANKAPVLSVADITERDALTDVINCQLVWVLDATGDSTVNSGAALYMSTVAEGTVSWTKMAEVESMDVILQWANIQGKPESAVADIDDAVAKRHEHANKAVLDGISENSDGDLVYHNHVLNGETGIAVGTTLENANDYTSQIQILLEEYDTESQSEQGGGE